nr:hypothetical protein Iba_chr03aCG15920 [Ipomoea batatas]
MTYDIICLNENQNDEKEEKMKPTPTNSKRRDEENKKSDAGIMMGDGRVERGKSAACLWNTAVNTAEMRLIGCDQYRRLYIHSFAHRLRYFMSKDNPN